MHLDEFERLEHFGEISVFENLPTADYLTIDSEDNEGWKLKSTIKPYHPVGTVEYDKEVAVEAEKHKRYLNIEEARILGDRLSKRRDHDHYCICELCQPNAASSHIKSFHVKPTKADNKKKHSR